jgi:hypothetical protein
MLGTAERVGKELSVPGGCPRELQDHAYTGQAGREEWRLPSIWLPVMACSLVPLGGLAWESGEASLGSCLFPSLSTCQVTGDPGAVLWLEEIRQEVVRANQDTNTVQKSKQAGQGH